MNFDIQMKAIKQCFLFLLFADQLSLQTKLNWRELSRKW